MIYLLCDMILYAYVNILVTSTYSRISMSSFAEAKWWFPKIGLPPVIIYFYEILQYEQTILGTPNVGNHQMG